jgi:hypothetical protein
MFPLPLGEEARAGASHYSSRRLSGKNIEHGTSNIEVGRAVGRGRRTEGGGRRAEDGGLWAGWLAALGEEPVHEFGFGVGAFGGVGVGGVLVFPVDGLATGAVEGVNHVAGLTHGHDVIGGAVKGPEGQAREARSSGGFATAANGNGGGKAFRGAGSDGPGAKAAHGLAGDVEAIGVEAEFGLQGIEQGEDEALSAFVPTAVVAPRGDDVAGMGALGLGGGEAAESVGEAGRVGFEKVFKLARGPAAVQREDERERSGVRGCGLVEKVAERFAQRRGGEDAGLEAGLLRKVAEAFEGVGLLL